MSPRRKPDPRWNPVAKAIARKRLADILTTEKIKLFLLAKGEDCEKLMIHLAQTVTIITVALEYDPAFDKTQPKFRVMQGGLSAMRQMAQAGVWDPVQAIPIEQAVTLAQEFLPQAKDGLVVKAFIDLTKLTALTP